MFLRTLIDESATVESESADGMEFVQTQMQDKVGLCSREWSLIFVRKRFDGANTPVNYSLEKSDSVEH